jgi:dTMP kinase
VREGYLARARAEPDRFRLIDAARPLAQVQADLMSHINKFLQAHDKA